MECRHFYVECEIRKLLQHLKIINQNLFNLFENGMAVYNTEFEDDFIKRIILKQKTFR